MPSSRNIRRKSFSARGPVGFRRNSFWKRRWKDVAEIAGASAAGLAYLTYAKAERREKVEKLDEEGGSINAKSKGIYKEMVKATEKAEEGDKELIERSFDVAGAKFNSNKGRKRMDFAEEVEKELRGENGQPLVEKETFEIVMEHAGRQSEELSKFNEVWEQKREGSHDALIINLSTMGIAIGLSLVLPRVTDGIEKAIVGCRSRRAQKRREKKKGEEAREAARRREEKQEKRKAKEEAEEEERKRIREKNKGNERSTPVVGLEPRRRMKRRRSKNELKKEVAEVLRPELGEDAARAAKDIFCVMGREGCKGIIDNPDEVYERIGECCGNGGARSNGRLEWVIDRISEGENGHEAVQEERDSSSPGFTYADLVFPADVEKAMADKGLNSKNVKRVIVNGFKLHTSRRAIGRVYHKTARIQRIIDTDLANAGAGEKEGEEIVEFLKAHGVISTYKPRGKCMMINTVPGLGHSRPVTDVGEEILSAVVEWLVEYKKRHSNV